MRLHGRARPFGHGVIIALCCLFGPSGRWKLDDEPREQPQNDQGVVDDAQEGPGGYEPDAALPEPAPGEGENEDRHRRPEYGQGEEGVVLGVGLIKAPAQPHARADVVGGDAHEGVEERREAPLHLGVQGGYGGQVSSLT